MKQFTALALMLSFAAICVAAPEDVKPDKKEFSCKCPISGGKAKKDQSVEYKKSKVYFCCGKCKAAFDAKNEKHTMKANAQLVSTGQFKQKGCPFSGGDVKKDTILTVAGAKVGFCCGNCEGKVKDAKEEVQLTMVYSEKAFAKGFEKVKKEKAE